MRSTLRSGLCAASVFLALSASVHAADIIEESPQPTGMEWYFSVFGGWSMPEEMDVAFYFYSIEISGAEFDDGFMAGAALGARFTDWLRGDIEVSGHRHELLALRGISLDVVGRVEAIFLLGNVWMDFPISSGLRPYVGGGIGLGNIIGDLRFDLGQPQVEFIEDADWAFAFQLGGGVALDITHNAVVDFGYRYKAIEAELQFADVLGGISPSKTAADYRSHNILLGLRFGF